jgi:hypothetical protein
MTQSNYGDYVIMYRNWAVDTANRYLNNGCPDPDYFVKLLETAAYWQQRYDDYVAHLKVTNTSFHLTT